MNACLDIYRHEHTIGGDIISRNSGFFMYGHEEQKLKSSTKLMHHQNGTGLRKAFVTLGFDVLNISVERNHSFPTLSPSFSLLPLLYTLSLFTLHTFQLPKRGIGLKDRVCAVQTTNTNTNANAKTNTTTNTNTAENTN